VAGAPARIRCPAGRPRQARSPGQASFYFNDPFGNHLEILTTGIDTTDIPVGVPQRDHLDHTWRGLSR
jgi:hypothetical protein